MPNSPSPRIFPSCAARRIRRKWWRPPTRSGLPPSASPTATALPAWCAPTAKPGSDNIKLLVGTRLVTDRRFRGARLSDRSRSLWPALPAADPRQSPGQKGRMPSGLRRRFWRPAKARSHRRAAAETVFRCPACGFRQPRASADERDTASSPNASPPWRARRRAARFSPALIIIAATSRAGLAFWPNSATRLGAPLVAVNDVFYHAPERRPLADIVTCVREKCTLAEAGLRLTVNAERHLKPAAEMARLFRVFPTPSPAPRRSPHACRFSLDELQYEYPDEPVPQGKTAQQHLADLTWAGARERYPKERYPDGIPGRRRGAAQRRTRR